MKLDKIMKQAQQMQSKMAQVQEALAKETVTGQAGGGMVTVTANGHGDIVSLSCAETIRESCGCSDIPLIVTRRKPADRGEGDESARLKASALALLARERRFPEPIQAQAAEALAAWGAAEAVPVLKDALFREKDENNRRVFLAAAASLGGLSSKEKASGVEALSRRLL